MGITLKSYEVYEIKNSKSASRALKVLAEYMIHKSIVKSPRIIVPKAVDWIVGTSSIPDLKTLTKKSWQELRELTITKM